METKKLTMSMEDYLRELYQIELQGEQIRVTDVAEILGISKASVNKAINALQNAGCVTHEHYGPVVLTEEGRSRAKNILDNYKVCLKFLVNVLGLPQEQAAQEAHLIEHAISGETRKRLKKLVKKQEKQKK